MEIDDSASYRQFSSWCVHCKHWWMGKRNCDAFQNKPIPEEIWTGQNKHTDPYPGDNGVTFEPLEPEASPLTPPEDKQDVNYYPSNFDNLEQQKG